MRIIKMILPAPLTPDEAARTTVLLETLIKYVNPAIFIFWVIVLLIGDAVIVRLSFSALLLLGNRITLLMMRRNRIVLAAFVFIANAWVVQTLFISYRGLFVWEMYTYLITIIVVGMLLGTRFGIVVAVMSILTVGAINLLDTQLVLIQSVSPSEIWLIFALTVMLIAIIQHLFNHTMQTTLQRAQKGEAAQQRFDNIIDMLPVGVFEADRRGQTYHFNQRYLEITGHSVEVLLGQKWLDVIHPEDRVRVEQEYYQQRDKNRMHFEYRMVRPDNSIVWLGAQTTVERDSAGQITGFIGAVIDITERKQVEEAQQISNQYLNAILTSSPDYAYVYNVHTHRPTLSVEKTFLGYDTAILSDINFIEQHTHPDDIRRVHTYWNNLLSLRRGEIHSIEFRSYSAEGHWEWLETRAVSINFTPENRPDEILILNTVITTRKNHERLLRHSEATARDFQKQLKALHEIGLELSRANTMNDLCRLAVEFGRSRLHFDRVSLNFFDHETEEVIGVYSTNLSGEILNEHNKRFPISQDKAVINIYEGRHPVFVESDTTLRDDKGAIVGQGWRVLVAIWDGNDILGYLSVDNQLSHQPIATYALELLTLYGSILGSLCSRKRADDLLRTSESRYRQLFETISDGIGVHDGKVWLDVNPAMTRMYGYERAQMIGKPIQHFITPASQQSVLEHVQNEDRSFYEVTSMRSNGELFDVEISAMSITQPDSQLVRVAVVRDITERKRAASELAMYSDRMKAILRHMPALSFRIDADGVLHDPHGEAFRLTRDTDPQVLDGMSIYNWAEPYRHLVEQALEGDTVFFEAEYDAIFTTVHPHMFSLIHLAFDVQRGSGALGFLLDVTELKHAEQRKFEVAVAQERVNLLREFISDASHDLKTPLSIILTKSQLIRTNPDPARRAYHLAALERQVLHLRKIIDDMLTMSRLDADFDVAFQPVNIDLVLDEVLSELQTLLTEKDIQLIVDYPSNQPSIPAVESELYRALTNLVENAIHYTSTGGSITIRSTIDEKAVVIEIADSGIGISASDLSHIFDRFYRASAARSVDSGGTGLGLAIVKKVIELHKGNIEVESELGSGSTFRVILPLSNGN